LEIYRPYIEHTAVSFELTVPTVEEFAQRIAVALETKDWLVAEICGEAVGFAYGAAHRTRAAYRHSVETSVYVRQDVHRRGVARTLYTQLLENLSSLGFANAYAGIALPNDASKGFHLGMGFQSIGVFPRVGRKFGRWHDVEWLHKQLRVDVSDEC
tara:strand:+ start:164 stop:631 length:468 start_codon:yes stop_codon:yes gene_type:complete